MKRKLLSLEIPIPTDKQTNYGKVFNTFASIEKFGHTSDRDNTEIKSLKHDSSWAIFILIAIFRNSEIVEIALWKINSFTALVYNYVVVTRQNVVQIATDKLALKILYDWMVFCADISQLFLSTVCNSSACYVRFTDFVWLSYND